MNKNLNFAFFGTPDVASRTLDILYMSGYIPSVVTTSPDARSGRGMHMVPSPVSIWADEHSIPCLKPSKIDDEFLEAFKKFNIDLSIVVAYGKILPEVLIKNPALGTINIHYSLLPKYRGASPLEQALLHGDTTTGVTIQQMEYKLDSGAILAREEINIDINETKSTLKNTLIDLGGNTLVDLIPKIINNNINPEIQDEAGASYCKKIKKEDGEIDPSINHIENYNKYRAYDVWPGIYFFIQKHGKNTRVKILKASYENNTFIIERVIPEGKKEISYTEFLKQIN